MIDASTLEDRTRPMVEPPGSTSARLRFAPWMSWPTGKGVGVTHEAMPTQARLSRR